MKPTVSFKCLHITTVLATTLVMTVPNSQHTSVYVLSSVVVFCHSVFLFCRYSLPNSVRFPLRPTILLHARASLHHAVPLHCVCAVPIWSELPDLHLLPVASSGPDEKHLLTEARN